MVLVRGGSWWKRRVAGEEGAVRGSLIQGTMCRVGGRIATGRICRFVGRTCPAVKGKAMCEGLSVLVRRKTLEGVRIPSKPGQFSFALGGRCRIEYMGYNSVSSISVSRVPGLLREVRGARKVRFISCSVSFGNVYPGYERGMGRRRRK